MSVEAKWSGEYPCLCFGEWTLKVNGKDVSSKIPKNLRKYSMNTIGTYQRWDFNNAELEMFEDYDDGLECEEWILENKEWLDNISTDISTQRDIFLAINAEDFRSGSCGGCI